MSQVITEISSRSRTSPGELLKETWAYRELFGTFVERDLRVRYRQTFLGIAWVLLYPLLFSGIFSVVFGKLFGDVAAIPKGNDRILFFLAALVPWQCFSGGISNAATSLEANSGLLGKIYFPRILVPASVLCSTVIDFAVGWIFFNVAAMGWGYWTWKFIIFTPVLLMLQLVAALGAGLVLAALNAQYRDTRYVVPFLIQMGFFVTPILYPLKMIPSRWLWAAWINPMAGVIETYRALLAGTYIPYKLLAMNTGVAVALAIFGVCFFQRRVQRIIDIL